MARKIFFGILLALSLIMLGYGALYNKYKVYDNLEKFDKLKDAGIKIKLPGYSPTAGKLKPQSEWFTEPEMVNAMTFSGVGKYKDGRLISMYPDLRMLKGRLPCPS